MRTEMFGYHYTQYTFGHILADQAAKRGNKLFLHYLEDGRTFTYREIHEQSNAVANALLAAGVGKGSHVAMMMENSPEQILAYFALAKLGAVCVPINTAARGTFLAYFLNQSDSTALLIDQSLLERFCEVAGETAIAQLWITEGATGAELPGSMREHAFAGLLAGNTANPPVDVSYRDLCALMYTSGTTGPSKGNMWAQIGLLTFSAYQAPRLRMDENSVYYAWGPLFHVAAYGGSVLLMLILGGSVALARRFSVSRFWDDVRKSDATGTILMTVGEYLFKLPPSPADRDHKLCFVLSTPVPGNFRDLQDRYGFKFMQGYGLSDYSLCTTLGLDDPEEKQQTIGRKMDDLDVRIVDDQDVDMPTGEIGEIVIRHNGMPFAAALGYYKMPDKTAESTTNLWFHTGDLGRVDADGYFSFVGRKKDAIRRRGENISAFEVEHAIFGHDAVAEVAVYPVNANTGDDVVAAAIVLAAGANLSERDLIDHCATCMPYFMVPRFVEFRPSLPRTTTDKVRKVELRAEMEAQLDSAWDREREGIKLKR